MTKKEYVAWCRLSKPDASMAMIEPFWKKVDRYQKASPAEQEKMEDEAMEEEMELYCAK